jgi:AcrR family transcriptional regulator
MSSAARGRPRSIDDTHILNATREALQAVGPSVTVREIARRAHISEGTIFRRYPAKSALVAAACGYDLWVLLEPFRALESQTELDLVPELIRLVDGFHRLRDACAPHSAAARSGRTVKAERDVENLVRLECTRALARVFARFVPTDDDALDWALAFVAVLWLEDPSESSRALRPLLALVGERQAPRFLAVQLQPAGVHPPATPGRQRNW